MSSSVLSDYSVPSTDESRSKIDGKEMGEQWYPPTVTIRDRIAAQDVKPDILQAVHVPPPSPSVPMAHVLYDPEDEDVVPKNFLHVPSDEEVTVCDRLINSPMNLVPHVPAIDIDMQTESNHDTALTLACSGGHDELVELLLEKGADVEHRDKKGCSPLILSATAGHASTAEILLQHCADIEAQSDRTKDTALSLACSGGRQEVIEILLNHGANFEHRNMSDYTPLSLAASGGYVGIIKLLLQHGAEINSRTGSKLGISPLMLAAMNGHTAAVKLLLDMGSDINAQIETNRNTALTLACFQGRHEVVSLLVERKANVEHRAKTGLTPLMEAASGGYVEVGKVLLEGGADVNALPVPSSKDTALTIAADKGHDKFVELLLEYGAQVDVRNKKGASPLWLACNGGHWEVVQHLINAGADPGAEDNRRVSCLVAAFRRGHVKVVKYLVKKVTQFPNDTDGARFISTISDKELLKRCKQSMEIIILAKDRQAAEANKHATILLQELDQERTREENRRAAAARKRINRRKQKQRKKEEKKERDRLRMQPRTAPDGSESENDRQQTQNDATDVEVVLPKESSPSKSTPTLQLNLEQSSSQESSSVKPEASSRLESESEPLAKRISVTDGRERDLAVDLSPDQPHTPKCTPPAANNLKGGKVTPQPKSGLRSGKSRSPASTDPMSPQNQQQVAPTQSPRRGGKRSEEGWKEVVLVRKVKRILVPGPVVSRVMGRGGSNIVSIRQASGAHVAVERGRAGQDRTVTIKGNTDAIRIASTILTALMKEPDRDVSELLPGKHNQGGSRRGSGPSGVRGIVRMQQPQHQLQQALGLVKCKGQAAVKAGEV
jgi:ankyrin repeat domain-containing protein 17